MKAILHTKYGPPDELQVKEVETPVPQNNEVLVKIHATTVTSSDCNVRNFTFVPKIFRIPARLMFGVFKPKIKILGSDLSGEIEVVGKNVTHFKKGDFVFGTSGRALGSHAQFTCIPETGVLATKPTNMDYKDAAAIFLGAHTALYYLRDMGNIQAGQKILIYGASGAVGTYAVMLAKHLGAEVTGVCSTTNLELIKSLGADKVIDYTIEDFTKCGETYDLIFDAVGKISFSQCKKSLKQKGIFLPVLLNSNEIFQMLWTSVRGGKKVRGGEASEKIEDLIFFKELIEAGNLKPVIDRCYPLEQTADAFRYVEKGHKKGNVVITVEHTNN